MRHGCANEMPIVVGDEAVPRHGLPERLLRFSSKRLGREDDSVICQLAEVQCVFGGIRVRVSIGAVIHDEVQAVEVGDLRKSACKGIEGSLEIERASRTQGCFVEDVKQKEHRVLAVRLALLAAVIVGRELFVEEDAIVDERPFAARYV